jgi:hypothetical protein
LQLCFSFSFEQLVARIKGEKKKEEVNNGKEGGDESERECGG